MSNAAQIIAEQYRNGELVKRSFGEAFYIVTAYGIFPGGGDVTAALQALVNKANAEGRTSIFLPHGSYAVSAISNDGSINYFGDNSSFTGGYSREITQIGGLSPSVSNDIVQRGSNIKTKPYNATGNGTTDDSAAFSTAATALSVVGGRIVVPAGTYKISNNVTIPSNIEVSFMPGAKLSVDTSKTLTLNGTIDAGYYQIFDGLGSIVIASRNPALPEWWGAKGDGSTNDSAAIQKAINAADVLQFCSASYVIGTEITVPQARVLQWFGKGFRSTIFRIADGITGFKYLRNSTFAATNWVMRDLQLLQPTLAKTSIGISFKGTSGYHDNWLRMYDCAIYGLFRGLDLGYCGQCHFVGNYAQANVVVYFLNRDSSFIWFDRCMNLGNNVFVYGDDSLADGVSNGINIHNCSSVFAIENDIRIVGWQCVYITGGGGFDLGGNATYQNAAIYLGKCMDFCIENVWVASDKTNSPNRVGIDISDSHSGHISGCSIVNNKIGIRIDGNASYATMITVDGNKFDGNTSNDVLLLSNITASKVVNNAFRSAPSRTGTDYEVYANTTGTDRNFIQLNTFKGASYTISSGANSLISNNIFAVGK